MADNATSSAGIGLDDFLSYGERKSSGGGGGGNFLDKWRDMDKKEGEVDVWLHTKARIHPSFTHPFIYEDVEEKGGESKKVLRFPRFISPDPKDVHQEQHFRDKSTGRLKRYPNRDPFLLLREWIRYHVLAGNIAKDTPVFEWVDYREQNTPIIWHAGHLSRTEERGKLTFGHSLDTKEEFLFTVVKNPYDKNGNPLDNAVVKPVLARESKSLGDKVSAAIKKQKESLGDHDGNPMVTPYLFRWKYKGKEANFNNQYDAFPVMKYGNGADLIADDEVWNAITEMEPPDALPFVEFKEEHLVKMRTAMQEAMQIALPLDLIFSPNVKDRMAVLDGAGLQGGTIRRATTQAQGGAQPPARTGAARPSTTAPQRTVASGAAQAGGTAVRRTVGGAQPAAQAQGNTAAPNTAQPAGRVRRAIVQAPPPPPPPPEEEMVPCDNPECRKPMKPTDTTCKGCGAVYEVSGASDTEAQASSGTIGESGSASGAGCMFCGQPVRDDAGVVKCTSCGRDQGEDIPF